MTNKQRSEWSPLIDRATGELGGRSAVAKELGVSSSSLARWHVGSVRPRPDLEGRLRSLANRQDESSALQSDLFGDSENSGEERLRAAVTATCRQLRESFHRRGRLSSRQEALDELAKLLFSHVMAATHGGGGIDRRLRATKRGPAHALRRFVSAQFEAHAPISLAHEMKPDDFALRLQDHEDDFAVDLIESFGPLQEPGIVASIQGLASVDVLNDAFGQFIADSFVQEKELGQYLTPNEVVRFMVRLAFRSLPNDTRSALLNPSKVQRAGLILDPSCGIGSFLTEALRVMFSECRKERGLQAAQSLVSNALDGCVVGLDKSERMLRLALTNLALFGADKVNLHLVNSLDKRGTDGKITAGLEGKAALILTNPPFGANFTGDALTKYRLVTEWVRRPPAAVDSELLFLERYLDWLAPGGHLVSIVPDSVLTNRGIFENVRSAIYDQAAVQTVVSLPAVTFGMAGTTTKTSILHLIKRSNAKNAASRVFFAVCDSVGYEVVTRGATRVRVPRGRNQLPDILEACATRRPFENARENNLTRTAARWDAIYNSGLSTAIQQRIERGNGQVTRVRDVASLSCDRFNPARLGTDERFAYIEIADVNGDDYSVRAKQIACSEAPSRARKRVRQDDVIVSTVRPERKTIGVVPPELDGAICSTGFAVLRCHDVAPLVLAHLLRHRFSGEQIVMENSGIAYPAIDEGKLLDIVLPIDRKALHVTAEAARRFESARRSLRRAEESFSRSLNELADKWVAS